jgi:P27 family predicted phage terminase small subunit
MPAPRKSANRKALAKTARADRRTRTDFAARLTKVPPAPRTLAAAARPIWRRLATACVGIGTLTLADLPLLELLANTLHAEAEARTTLAADGPTIAAGSGGRKKHPCAAIAETARAQAVTMLREVGLTPRARQGVDTAPPAGAVNPFTRHGRAPDPFAEFVTPPGGGAGWDALFDGGRPPRGRSRAGRVQ